MKLQCAAACILPAAPRSMRLGALLLVAAFFATACAPSPQPPEGPRREGLLQAVGSHQLTAFTDDFDRAALKTAIERSLEFYRRTPAGRPFAFGDQMVCRETLQDTLLHFAGLLDSAPEKLGNPEELSAEFDLYTTATQAPGGASQLLVTGYYEPILAGSRQRDEHYRYPLYGLPADLVTADLALFDRQRFGQERLVGRLEGNRFIPYFTRGEIDARERLERCGCQIVWLADEIDAFFLHIQGSGQVCLPNGSTVRVGYAGSNGRPYRSIGKYLLDRGEVAPEAMSLQLLRAHLRAHPERVREILDHNESYVFFREVPEGPLGSLGVVLTAGRSVAADASVYPRGGLMFVETEQPVLDDAGHLLGWKPLRRWVLVQDAGGAIRGAGRLDLFCGSGEPAERVAGVLKQPGRLYLVLKKGAALAAKPLPPASPAAPR
jgi:membrane-bound lytic murein transglycosylase A